MTLAKWKLIELATTFVEQSLEASASNVTVEHDARIPDRGSGALRQVDVAVRYSLGGRSYLRTVEVQNRGRKIGSSFVDSIVTKADRIGAHRTTVVSTHGFTKPALQRIAEQPHLLDAARLKPLRVSDLPELFRTMSDVEAKDDSRGGVVMKTAVVEYWTYERLDGSGRRQVAISDLSIPGTEAAGAIILDPDDVCDEFARVTLAALAKPGSQRQLNRIGMRITRKDGSVSVLQAMRRAPIA